MAGASSNGFWQSTLLDELLDAIEQNPSNVEAQKLLAQQYQALGWDDAAADIVKTVLASHPNDQEAQFILASSAGRGTSVQHQTTSSDPPPPYSSQATDASPPGKVQNVKQLKSEYEELQNDAKSLLRELLVFQELAPHVDCAEQIADLTALSEGRMFSVARRTVGRTTTGSAVAASGLRSNATSSEAPCSAGTLAASMKQDPDSALDVAIADFRKFIHWNRGNGITAGADEDALRTALRKRADTVKAALPKKIAHLALEAFMHAEHEYLRKTYVNSETMLGDPVSDIPRSEFWVSDDGYAWDMSELVQAIEANTGALQNPLTRENFTVSDVEAIIRHPSGKRLAALQVEQSKLVKGVRQATITRIRSMATILLSDDSANSHPSHCAVDDFLAYVATLPVGEREAIDKLRVPAIDSHTGLSFNDTIGDAVRDAKGNRVCFHKAGDLLKQAAGFLDKTK